MLEIRDNFYIYNILNTYYQINQLITFFTFIYLILSFYA